MDESGDQQAEAARQRAGSGRDKEAGLQTAHRQAGKQLTAGKKRQAGRNREAGKGG
jgi:hypothetical protein